MPGEKGPEHFHISKDGTSTEKSDRIKSNYKLLREAIQEHFGPNERFSIKQIAGILGSKKSFEIIRRMTTRLVNEGFLDYNATSGTYAKNISKDLMDKKMGNKTVSENPSNKEQQNLPEFSNELTTQEKNFLLSHAPKKIITILTDKYHNDPELNTIINSLIEKGYLQPSVSNHPNSQVWSYNIK